MVCGISYTDAYAHFSQGLQVAPAELEAHLLTHPGVADCAVIPVPGKCSSVNDVLRSWF